MKTVLAGILALSSAAGIAAAPHDPSLEIGLRYWLSSGKTQWAHNAQDAAPILGNPTSILTYERLSAQTVELNVRKTLGTAWFIKGNAGAGSINRGSFDDEDYFVGQLKFSDTTSPVRGKRVAYATLDAGRNFFGGRDGAFFLFTGYQVWTERADAYGLTYTVPAGAPGLADSVAAVSNEVRWQSVRLGAGVRSARGGTQVVAEVAFVPYTRLHNEDSHHLRTDPADLGPVPNIRHEGRGNGVQLDVDLRHAISRNYELGAGFRFWKLATTSGTDMAAGMAFPLVRMQSERSGVTVSLTRRW